MSQNDLSDAGLILAQFTQRVLDQYTSAYNDFFNSGDKNRLAAVREIESKMPREHSPDFEFAKRKLLQIIQHCEKEFDPPYDTERGSGRGVFSLYAGEIECLMSVEDCLPTRYAVTVYTKDTDELVDKFFLKGVQQDVFKKVFDPQCKDDILEGGYRINPSQVAFLECYIPEVPSLGRKLSWALKTISWNFDDFAYFLEPYTYEVST